MNKKIMGFLLIFSILSALFLIIYTNRNPLETADVKLPHVEVVIKSSDYENFPFWDVVRQGVETAAEDFQVTVFIQGPPSETQIDLQIEMIRKALERRPQAIVAAAADFKRLAPIAGEIQQEGIPLITIDSFIDSDIPVSRIGTDNHAAGYKAGEALQDFLPPEEASSAGAQIAIISYLRDTSSQIDREEGVRDFLFGKLTAAGTWYCNADIAVAEEQVRQILLELPEVTGFVALNEQATVGAARAIEAAGRGGSVTLIGFDNSPPIIQFLENGVIQAIIVQKPFNMGYLGIKSAVDTINGTAVDAVIDTGSVCITRDTMYTSENQKLLFPVNRE
jgi:ribose transport system substrate-binding protein